MDRPGEGRNTKESKETGGKYKNTYINICKTMD
jgi:hypothetical protein